MGAWDEGPRENDTALDHELHIFGCPGREDLGPQDPEEQRYVAWLVTQLKPDFPGLRGIVKLSLNRMKALLCDTDWVENWKRPSEVIASIKEQIVELEKIASRDFDDETCQRCDSPLKQGLCQDETCPFSDTDQDDERGWAGHPDKS